jgi:hypothetical protein
LFLEKGRLARVQPIHGVEPEVVALQADVHTGEKAHEDNSGETDGPGELPLAIKALAQHRSQRPDDHDKKRPVTHAIEDGYDNLQVVEARQVGLAAFLQCLREYVKSICAGRVSIRRWTENGSRTNMMKNSNARRYGRPSSFFPAVVLFWNVQ